MNSKDSKPYRGGEMTDATSYHVGLSVRGALKNYTKREMGTLLRTPGGGRYLTADEATDALLDQLSQGREIIPIGAACDRWDWKEGCMGHPERAASTALVATGEQS